MDEQTTIKVTITLVLSPYRAQQDMDVVAGYVTSALYSGWKTYGVVGVGWLDAEVETETRD